MKKSLAMGIDILGTGRSGSTWSDRYMSAILDVPDMPEPKIELINMMKVFYIYFILTSIAIFILTAEILLWKYIVEEYEISKKEKLEGSRIHEQKPLLRQRTM